MPINKNKPSPLPYYGSPGFINSVKNSSRARGISSVRFIIKKLLNHVFLSIAYSCPINFWRVKLNRWRGVNIGRDVFIGLNVIFDRAYPELITIEDGVQITGGNHILTHSRPPEFFKGKLLSYAAPVKICRNSWIGINSIIIPNITIGEGAVIGAGALVDKNIPSNCVAKGNPISIIKTFD